MIAMVQVADLSHENFKSGRVMRWWLSRLSSRFGAKSSRERKPKWLPGLIGVSLKTRTPGHVSPTPIETPHHWSHSWPYLQSVFCLAMSCLFCAFAMYLSLSVGDRNCLCTLRMSFNAPLTLLYFFAEMLGDITVCAILCCMLFLWALKRYI